MIDRTRIKRERENDTKREGKRERDGDGNRKSMHRPVAYDALSGILCTSAHALSRNDVFVTYRAGE